ncbi:SDR family oxidoreductase [Bacillus suaedaesalsae]|uniref:dTDP-4-dehydrorhamnose reductase n=1 Tax=Bacillus suaedaesalsae TaxID=2810349 RepID=A0ABS2DKS4_9BACI|nr:sugar nucleotide-binding protein [Bacillus suaedaesalsae]MBM6619097.1 sugar nucleotide-binding protein [Bacillus suaedaesalsae]
MKFLILGASGMAGHTISIYLNEQGHDVTTFTTSKYPFCKNIIGNALDKDHLKSILNEGRYDVVINCIGILNHFCIEEPSKAVYLNSYLPHYLADLLKNTTSRLFHMSTDCVFSGANAPYSEHSNYDGDSFYDRTKALGEICDDKNLTFRNSIIGPDMKENGIGLLNWFMKQKGTIMGYEKAIWTGVTTLTLAKAMESAAFTSLTGIYNLVNNENISKYELLALFNKHLREGEVNIIPSNDVNLNKTLINNRKDFNFIIPSYENMVIEMKDWILKHENLYPEYYISK